VSERPLDFRRLLRRHRRARGLTQEELAARALVGVRTVSDLERGVHRTARRSTVRRLADALELGGAELAAFEAAGAGESGPPPAGLPPLFDPFPDGPFVGRREELDRLCAVWERTAARGRMVTVVGEPGIGKTRLAAEAAQHAATDGALVLAGRCDEHVVLPYGPVAECLRHVVGGRPPGPLDRLPGAGQLAALLPELTGAGTQPAARRGDGRPELPVAVSTALADLARATRLLLVVDDFHWADRPTVLVLRHLASTAPPGLLVVVTYQGSEVPPGSLVAATLADLRRAGVVEDIRLGGLGLDEVAELLARRERGRPRPRLARSVLERTGGNPFFVEEVLRHLAEGSGGTEGVPVVVREVLATRLARLPEPVVAVLRVASVLGSSFDLPVLVALADESPARLSEVLDQAVAAGLLEEPGQPVGRFRFTHVLVRDALYEGLGWARRAGLHQRAGHVLEALLEEGGETASVAHHFAAAASPATADRVVRYALQAGDHARGLGAHRSAADHYELALWALATAPGAEDRRCELLLAVGEARTASLERQRARPAFLEAARSARRLGRPDLVVRAARGYGYMTKAGEVGEGAGELWQAALAEAAAGDRAGRAVLRAAAATAAMLDGDVRAEELAAAAVADARAAGDDALTMALATRCIVLWGSDAVEERLALATELLDRARARDDPEATLDGLELRGVPLLELGRAAEFDETAEDLLRLGAEQGNRAVAQGTQWRALRALMAGRFDEGEQEAAEVLERSGDAPNFATGYAAQLYVSRRGQGRAGELLPELVAYVEAHPEPAWRAVLAAAHAEAGRLDEARAELDRLAASGFADLPRTWTRPVTLALAAECAARVGDRARATLLHPLLAPRRGQLIVVASGTSCEGAVDRYLGALEATLGDDAAADTSFAAALALEEAAGGTALTPRTRVAHAQALLARARPDRAAARRLLDDAERDATRLGMAGVAAEVETLRHRS
jgi:transcriptional regulator with XRE-family HTH domain